MALYVSSPSLAQNRSLNEPGDDDKGGERVRAPELDGQTAALGVALAASAVAALKGRFRRNRQ
jgi:hypothetical protein